MSIKTITVLFVCVFCFTITFTSIVIVELVESFSKKSLEIQERVIDALQQGNWLIPEDYYLFADEEYIGAHPKLLEEHEDGWICFPGELQSKKGPWKYACDLWYNTKTKETYIQKN
jgi:hypothetical protein